jgi:hypothetical protein
MAWLLPVLARRGRRQHRLRIPENAPQKTTQSHRLTQRQALARRTPHTGIDLLDTDPYPVRPCCLELGRFQPKNNPKTTWTTTDSKVRDMSQWVHNEKDLNMSKYFRCFTANVHSWAGRLKARGVVGSLLISLVGERLNG